MKHTILGFITLSLLGVFMIFVIVYNKPVDAPKEESVQIQQQEDVYYDSESSVP